MFVSATLDIGDVEKGLDAMQRRSKALGPAFQALKKPMREDQKEHRKTKTGPSGSWAPRSAATLAAHHGKRKLARTLLGKLPTAVSYKATAHGVTGESKVKWSAVHQEGGSAGHGAKIPARPFLWISDKLLDLAVNIIDTALVAAFGGR